MRPFWVMTFGPVLRRAGRGSCRRGERMRLSNGPVRIGGGAGVSPGRARRVGEVVELRRPVCGVGEGPRSRSRSALEVRRAGAVQARPLLEVLDGRRAEGGEVAEDERLQVELVVWPARRRAPRLQRRVRAARRCAPQSPRGGTWTSGTCARTCWASALRVGVRPARAELPRRAGRTCAARPRPARGRRAASVVAVDVVDRVVAVGRPRDHRLDERAQHRGVARGDEVDRPAHQDDPDRRARLQQRRQLGRVEAAQARHELEVRRLDVLGLEADEVLDRLQRASPRRGSSSHWRASSARLSARGSSGGRSAIGRRERYPGTLKLTVRGPERLPSASTAVTDSW